MFPLRTSHRMLLVALAMLAVASVVAACASGSAAEPAGASSAASRAAKQDAFGVPASNPGGSTGSTTAEQAAADQSQRIVKTGEVTLEIDSVANGLSRVRAMAVELGGYVGGSQAGTLDESATLTLRIPATRFDDALSRLHEIGTKVLVESTHEEDVTSAIVDLEARLENLRASEAQYRALMAKATKIEDILGVQSRLDDVRGQIEQLSGQLKSLGNQADLSTLTVTLQPKEKPIQAASSNWDPGDIAGSAVGALLQVGQGVAAAGIWFAIVGLPIVIGLAILAFIAARLGLLRRRPVSTAAREA